MASAWQGGSDFILIRRGSNNARKGGTHSGPSGYKAKKWYVDNHNPKIQSEQDRAAYAAMTKAGKRNFTVKISSLIRKYEPVRYAQLVAQFQK